MRPTQDIAVGVAKLKEQMSNPMFLASRNPTDARHPKQQNEQEVNLNIEHKESVESRSFCFLSACVYDCRTGGPSFWDGTASGGGVTGL